MKTFKYLKNSVLLGLILSLSLIVKAGNENKRYELKSGIVEYNITISGKTLGQQISGSGIAKLYFTDYGTIELNEEESNQTTTIKIFGKKREEMQDTHTLLKLENGITYSVDFENETIYKFRTMGSDAMYAKTNDPMAMGFDAMESLGGEKTGSGKILGYNCDIWEVMGSKIWFHKAVPLKLESTVMGIKMIKEATSAKFNVPVNDSYFSLPNFDIEEEDLFFDDDESEDDFDDMEKEMEAIKNMSYDEWKKLVTAEDPEMQSMSEAELRQVYDLMQRMIENGS